jgi:mannose-6-phosphate isomerase-like protein (cupin superfamily)
MAQDHLTVGIVVARRRLKGPWQSYAWLPLAALPAAPDLPVGTRLGAHTDEEHFYAGSATVTLNASETGHYADNLTAAQPSLWVVLRPVGDAEVEVVSVTADPYEGEALAESMGEIVEAVPMPIDVQAWVRSFFEAFHVERQFFKRKRDRADPEALGRRAGARRKDES